MHRYTPTRYVTHGVAGRGDRRQVQVLAVPAVADCALLLSAPTHMNNDSLPAPVAVSYKSAALHVSGVCLSAAGSCYPAIPWSVGRLGSEPPSLLSQTKKKLNGN